MKNQPLKKVSVPEVVKMLEEMLVDAKAGNIQGVLGMKMDRFGVVPFFAGDMPKALAGYYLGKLEYEIHKRSKKK